MTTVILLVDDDNGFRESVRDILDIEGYQVIDVERGSDALALVKEEDIDLVITDILMPDIEGVELTTKIKKLKPGLKVIGMTGGGAIGADKVLKVCSSVFFDSTLRKPFSCDELLTAIEYLLPETEKRKRI